MTDQPDTSQGASYAQAGVDIAAGDALVDAIKPAAKATNRPGTMGGLGLSLIHISEPTRPVCSSRMPSSA